MDPSVPPARYLHGYTPKEQARLVEQAEYWRETLILPDLPFAAGECLLDVGCGAGAVLGVIASAYPGLHLAGIDREPRQIEAASAHLEALGVAAATARQPSAFPGIPTADQPRGVLAAPGRRQAGVRLSLGGRGALRHHRS